MKQEHYIFGLIGVGAVVVLYWLYRESMAAAPPLENQPVESTPAAAPVYPNAQPIQLGNVYIGDTPGNQSYNMQPNGQQIPRVAVTGTPQSACGCEDEDCEAAGTPVTVQGIPQSLVEQGAKNLASFTAKVSSGVEAARNLGAAAPAPTAIAPVPARASLGVTGQVSGGGSLAA